MRTTILLGFLIFSGSISQLHAQDLAAYEKRVFKQGKYTMPYRILFPDNYDQDKTYPLLLFLHGSGERGQDNEAQLIHGAKLFPQKEVREKFPAIVVFPQCPKESFWSNQDRAGDKIYRFNFHKKGKPTLAMATVQKLLKNLRRTLSVDKDRIYVGGLSMGGMGTFEIVRRNPKTFAAAFPICGGANPEIAPMLTKVNWWVFHGEADNTVNYSYSQKMVDALKDEGGKVKFSLYPGVGHNSWDNAFAEPELLPWLFANVKK
ncbi:alpha/beta hydrolase-fold protein [Spongiimicrobium sp. 3-5]|uniref:carboxylesterase family protein n=1 Tax=Spongiimicrobium sp. 3-5 TaxID=3332596 RepID=UPI00397E95ED